MLFAGLAVAASTGLLLSGCGAGQVSSTADMVAAVDGVDTEAPGPQPGSFYKVRNLTADFKLEGYPVGSDARLSVALYNDTATTVTVRVTSEAAQEVRLVNPNATPPAPTATATQEPTATPTGSPTPAAPTTPPVPGGPATFTIPAGGYVLLNQEQGSYLLLTGLREELSEGNSVPVVFDFGGQQIATEAGLAVPLTPLPRGEPVVPDEAEEH